MPLFRDSGHGGVKDTKTRDLMEVTDEVIVSSPIETIDSKGRKPYGESVSRDFQQSVFPFVVRVLSSSCCFSSIRRGDGNVPENGDMHVSLLRLGCSGQSLRINHRRIKR